MTRIVPLGLWGLLAVGLLGLAPSDTLDSASQFWRRQFAGRGHSEAYGVAADSTGVYVVGCTTEALGAQNKLGEGDAFVRKYDADGAGLWTKQFGTRATDGATDVHADAGGVYLVGYTVGALPGQTSAGEYDAFVAKYRADGTEEWTKQFGTPGWDGGDGVWADASGVYVIGWVAGALAGQSTAGESDAFVRKYDLNGNELWTRQFGTPKRDRASGVCGDSTGVYVVGHASAALPAQTSAGWADAFVRKYDLNGNELWTRQFGGAHHDYAGGVCCDVGGVYVVGQAMGGLPGQPVSGDYDIFVRKYGRRGGELWTRQFGSPLSDWANDCCADDQGVYVVGSMFRTMIIVDVTGVYDAFVAKYDPMGTELWRRQFGGGITDEAHGCSAHAGGLYVVGRTEGGASVPGGARNTGAFVAKLRTQTRR